MKRTKQPPRVEWGDFPDAVLLASEIMMKRHLDYAAAKSGDVAAAARLVRSIIVE